MRVLLIVCGALVALAAPAGAVASAPPTRDSASATCKKQQKQGRACRPIAKPTAKAPWKFRDKSLPLSASFDGKKLKVIKEAASCIIGGDENSVKREL